MKPKSIGILGGAGPKAGALLFERILSFSMRRYGCYKDADFPKIFLLNFPFSDMLSEDMDQEMVRIELDESLNQLRQLNSVVIGIACNTLHVFLEKKRDLSDLILLPEIVRAEIPSDNIPLVLCTSTSRRARLHEQFFPCLYPNSDVQRTIDQIIDAILREETSKKIVGALLRILKSQMTSTIVLGCTELSIFSNFLKGSGKRIIDPLDLMAEKIVDKSFLN